MAEVYRNSSQDYAGKGSEIASVQKQFRNSLMVWGSLYCGLHTHEQHSSIGRTKAKFFAPSHPWLCLPLQ